MKSQLGELDSIKSQLAENTQLTKAIYDRQTETDAKLEVLSMDVHKAYGKITNSEENPVRVLTAVKIIKNMKNPVNIVFTGFFFNIKRFNDIIHCK